MLNYHDKILLALSEALKGNEEIYNWLLNNGYKELAVFTSAVEENCSSCESFAWLIKNKYYILAAVCDAVNGNIEALKWLKKNNFKPLVMLVIAVNGNKNAYLWLEKNNKFLKEIVTSIRFLQNQKRIKIRPF